MNMARGKSPNRRPLVRRFFLAVVIPLVPLLFLLPSSANAQRVASLGSRLKRRFGGSGSESRSYVLEQGEDIDGSCEDYNRMSSVIHVLANRPGIFAVGLVVLLGYSSGN
jgi:hypothetical protein